MSALYPDRCQLTKQGSAIEAIGLDDWTHDYARRRRMPASHQSGSRDAYVLPRVAATPALRSPPAVMV